MTYLQFIEHWRVHEISQWAMILTAPFWCAVATAIGLSLLRAVRKRIGR